MENYSKGIHFASDFPLRKSTNYFLGALGSIKLTVGEVDATTGLLKALSNRRWRRWGALPETASLWNAYFDSTSEPCKNVLAREVLVFLLRFYCTLYGLPGRCTRRIAGRICRIGV